MFKRNISRALSQEKSSMESLHCRIDEFVKSQKPGFSVIPAKAGIQLFQHILDPDFRRGDDLRDFLRDHQD
jgi:hypothetical protein